MELVQNMNENQLKAILKTQGAVMVIAGAGSGKTRVLTNRIAYLIAEKNVLESNILAITFTNKAAKEMKERVYSLVGETSKYIWINTFHSMCVRILRQHIDLLGYNKNFTILDTSEQKTIIKNIVKELNLSEDSYQPNTILKIISNSKNSMISVNEMKAQARFGFMKNVVEIYEYYQKYLKKNSVLDFDDLMLKTIVLFEKHPEVLAIYQNKFEYIHVDEYQDTNVIQYKLIKMLSEVHKNICIVGDDDQSIYSWRGACSDNIINFEKDYEDVEVIFLDQNYRSNSTILDAANAVIKNNTDRKDKALWSENKGGDKITVYAATNDKDETDDIAKKILDLKAQGVDYKDIAILYRANYLSRSMENSCMVFGIPYKLIGSLKFLQRQEIRDLLAYMNVIVNKNDEFSLRRIINVPKRGIGASSMAKIDNYAEQYGLSLFEALKNIDMIGVSKKIITNIHLLTQLIEKYSQTEQYSIEDLIVGIYKDSGYESMLKESADAYAESRIENISELVSSAKQFSSMNDNLIDFISEMSLTSDADDENEDDSVVLSTVHAAKGLEYRVVFIMGLEENLFPSIRDAESSEDERNKMEEERRLAYVAITRAKEKLFMSYANRRMQFGSIKNNKRSRFLDEVPNKLMHFESGFGATANDSGESQLESVTKFISRLSPKIKIADKPKTDVRTNYVVGDIVVHKKFGEGKVLSIEKDSVKVDFEKVGPKILLIEYANLTRKE
ncbi:ATP-dependent DNA helicase pcrA [Gemella morbillorum]|uniref:ATP-dependent helicase n=1 Tax=Gemella morbillorum TaxID=29391 RepID=UPI000DA2E233|nr:UvrD-helicase domain-containing protein [Gemella morbillorum]UBH80054.1 UvrD-helicase domain-containing protein [Gemella morbillorum]SQH55436.1 ATP-dependent DNA helicase pcrA [Gemella morbillorum]